MAHDLSDARALAHDLGARGPKQREHLPLECATGRLLTEDLEALVSVPSAPLSAMDGWAVAGPAPWLVGEPITAGSPPRSALEPGHARPISTGAVVPPGASAVVRSENGLLDPVRGTLCTSSGAVEGDHIRAAAEETRRGEVVLRRGVRLTPPRVAVAAMCGYDRVPVACEPTVDLLILGNEVVTAGVPPTGSVRDAFRPQFPAIVTALGGRMACARNIGDDLLATTDALIAATADIVVTTGGSSRGQTDFMRTALGEVDAELVIDGVDMRPGHPLMLAALPAGRFVLALPGNPLAAIVGMLTVGVPLLGGLLGLPPTPLPTAVLGFDVAPSARSRVIPYRLECGLALPTDWQGSAMMRGLAEAAGLCVVPARGGSVGDRVQALPLPWRTEEEPPPRIPTARAHVAGPSWRGAPTCDRH